VPAENPVSVSLFPPQMTYGLPLDVTRKYALSLWASKFRVFWQYGRLYEYTVS